MRSEQMLTFAHILIPNDMTMKDRVVRCEHVNSMVARWFTEPFEIRCLCGAPDPCRRRPRPARLKKAVRRIFIFTSS